VVARHPVSGHCQHDPAVRDRVGVIFLLQFCATGNSEKCLDWHCQHDLQTRPDEQASWDAVVAGHDRLRGLLADPDRAVAGAALSLLAWTGDESNSMLAAIRSALDSDDDRDHCNGWLTSVVLGQLPSGVTAPASLTGPGAPGRFGAAVASLRFGGGSALPEAVDELCSVFASAEARKTIMTSEFMMAEEPEWVAALVLATVPAHLRDHASAQLLTAIAREALLELVDSLGSWGDAATVGHRIHELEQWGLPGTRDQLAAWLKAIPS
jgi:hypothetical protein